MSSTQDGRPQYGPQPGGQPQNGPPQYGYQQYGPPQGPPQQYGLPPNYPPPAAPKKRKKWPWILLAVFVLIVGMFACSAGGGEDTETTSGGGGETSGTEEAPEEEGAESLGIGDTGQVGDWMVTVNGSETTATYVGEFSEEQAQGEFVIVDLTVENGGSDATYFDDTALSLIDADGNKHSASGYLGDDFFLEQINPGNQATGKTAFDVPEGTEAVALEVEDTFSFEDPIEIKLN